MVFNEPEVARNFSSPSATAAVVHFGSLSPLIDGSPWSVIAVLRPTGVAEYGGIVARRAGFDVGNHQFSCLLIDGHFAVSADNKERRSKLVPPLDEWSMACAAMSAEGVQFCLGLSTGQVQEESTPAPLPVGTTSTEIMLRVGHLGGSFPGMMGLVCLYSQRLDVAAMRAACAGEINPLDLPGLAFAWQPSASGDSDRVSRRVPVITGTRLWPEMAPADAELLKPRPFHIEQDASAPAAVAAAPAARERPRRERPSSPSSPAPPRAAVADVEIRPRRGEVPADPDVELLRADVRKKKVDNRQPFDGVFDAEFTVTPAEPPESSPGLLGNLGRKLGLGPKKK